MVGTLRFVMCRNVPKRCGFGCFGVLWFGFRINKVLDTEAPMLALPLRLPTASYGGHMGHFLLSTLALMGSTPLGNTCVFVSSMCSAVKLCVGVCTVGAHARVLARARRCVLRRCRLMSPRASGAARPASSPGATVRRPAPRPTRHGAVHARSFDLLRIRYNDIYSACGSIMISNAEYIQADPRLRHVQLYVYSTLS